MLPPGVVVGKIKKNVERLAGALDTSPAAIAPASVARVLLVDWRQLRRWGIDERLLPSDAVTMFREPTTWEKYRIEITLGLAVLILQAGLIAALLLERRSRRRTASALAASQRQMSLAASAASLSLWVWDTAGDKVKPAGRFVRTKPL